MQSPCLCSIWVSVLLRLRLLCRSCSIFPVCVCLLLKEPFALLPALPALPVCLPDPSRPDRLFVFVSQLCCPSVRIRRRSACGRSFPDFPHCHCHRLGSGSTRLRSVRSGSLRFSTPVATRRERLIPRRSRESNYRSGAERANEKRTSAPTEQNRNEREGNETKGNRAKGMPWDGCKRR